MPYYLCYLSGPKLIFVFVLNNAIAGTQLHIPSLLYIKGEKQTLFGFFFSRSFFLLFKSNLHYKAAEFIRLRLWEQIFLLGSDSGLLGCLFSNKYARESLSLGTTAGPGDPRSPVQLTEASVSSFLQCRPLCLQVEAIRAD